MAQVSLRKVVKKYDEVEAVSAIDLDIADKEFVVLVGPSGCGKSTTLRMIAGLEDITGGEISVDGEVVNDVPPKDRDMAMVFQNYALYPHMTVYQNRSEEHTSELQSRQYLVCRLLLEKKKKNIT